MQAEMNDVLELLSGSQQFEIPLYQRPYSWKDKDRAQLWADVVAAGKDLKRKKHFIGSIVYTQPAMRMGGGGIKRARLIDGQQRLTTLTLLISALVEQLAEKGDLELPTGHGDDTEKVRATKWREKYLLNEDLTGDSQYKLLPTHVDRATFKHLLGDAPKPYRLSPEIMAGQEFFRQQFRTGQATLAEVITGLRKLEVVAVMLQEGKDDPQLIFESLNSTGKELSPADLIRNKVLMGLEPEQQDALSRDYWLPMEALFQDSPPGSFDRFMRDYLTVRSGGLVDEKKVYEAFKNYREKSDQSVTDLVADIYQMAQYYATYLHPEREQDPDLQLALRDLQGIRVRVISPFVLVLLADRDKGIVNTADVVTALRAIESMLVRRAVSDFRSNPLNKLFATAGQQLKRTTSAEYLRSVELVLMGFQDRNKGGFPDDATFRDKLQHADIYTLDVCKHILMRLERDLSPKEKLVMDNLTVEHVLPQNLDLSKAWQDMLGDDWQEIQEQLKHTLGNLTLTGYNSELGDKAFEEKKTLPEPKGYANSRLLMTQNIAKQPLWNAETIRNRAAELSERAIKLWPVPSVPSQELQAFRTTKATRSPATGHTYVGIQYHNNLSVMPTESIYAFEVLEENISDLDLRVKNYVNARVFYARSQFMGVSFKRGGLGIEVKVAHDTLQQGQKNIWLLGRSHGAWSKVDVRDIEELKKVWPTIAQAFALQSISLSETLQVSSDDEATNLSEDTAE